MDPQRAPATGDAAKEAVRKGGLLPVVARLAASALAHLHGGGCGRGDADRWPSRSAALVAGCAGPTGACGGALLLQGHHRHAVRGFSLFCPRSQHPRTASGKSVPAVLLILSQQPVLISSRQDGVM